MNAVEHCLFKKHAEVSGRQRAETKPLGVAAKRSRGLAAGVKQRTTIRATMQPSNPPCPPHRNTLTTDKITDNGVGRDMLECWTISYTDRAGNRAALPVRVFGGYGA